MRLDSSSACDLEHPHTSGRHPASCQNRRVNDSLGRSPIGGHRYASGAHDLVRYKPDPIDDQIRGFVDGTAAQTSEQLNQTRAQFDADDFYTLLAFARRQAARALREGDLDLASCAIDALTLVSRDKIDFRDLSVDFPLYAVRELGGDLTRTIDRAVDRCEPDTAGCFEAARGRAPSLTLTDCALIRVSTSHGMGFMDDWTGATQPPSGVAGAAVALADLIDAEGSYLVRDVKVTELPGVWFAGAGSVEDITTRGCVSLSADHVSVTHPYSHSLMVFVAELPSSQRATELARAASASSSSERPRSAEQIDRFMVLFIGGSATMGESPLETAASLERFHPMVHSAVAAVAE